MCELHWLGMNQEQERDLVLKNVASEPCTPADIHIDPAEEAKTLRKVDFCIIPMLGLLYLMSFLDRSNIGNANVAGIGEDLHLKGNQFGTAVSVVYATYVTFEPVFSNLLKYFTPRLFFTASCFAWGLVTLCTGFVQNFSGLLAARLVLGFTEAGLFPCVNLYITMNYKREEQARRLSYVYLFAALSGAFGGLFASALIQMDGLCDLSGWRWLYIIEGIMSILVAPLAYYWIPNTMKDARWLSEHQKQICAHREQNNLASFDPNDKFEWKTAWIAIRDWKTILCAVMQFAIDITLYALTTFMPSIIEGLGYAGSTLQLLTVPVYATAAISFITAAWLSDRLQLRGPFVIGFSIINATGFAILIGENSPGARFVGLFIVALGLYVVTAINLTWINGNVAGHYKRATSAGVMQLVGNSAGAAVGQIFSTRTAPRYIRGMWVALGGSLFTAVLAMLMMVNLWRINKQKLIRMQNEKDDRNLGDANPHYRYIL